MKKWVKWLLSIVVALVLVTVGALVVVKNKTYQPSTAALTAAKVSTTTNGVTKFRGDDRKPMVIFYPGALVEPKSYSIWAKRVAQAGFSVYIVRFPLDLAVLKPDAARPIQGQKDYVIGGHSLGGTMASRYGKQHQKHLKGVFFLASYPEAKGDLQGTSVPVLSLTGTKDGVLDRANYKKAKKYLPSDTVYESITGGNHAGFGSYGAQSGDNRATISNQKQQEIISKLLIDWLDRFISE